MELEVYLDITKLDDDFALVVSSHAEETIEFFNERGLDGNGDTWAGIVESIVRLEMPEMYDRFSLSPEADDLLVTCDDRQLLERLGQCIRRYVADETLMAEAIENGDPDWLE
ncbi:MAG TPA: Imm51 family immunity protein [Thermoguttaceae bacterium]|nr:Imm51 family immunity protein [Thermoguttaceae bacterium]